jgi:hypothetical protein
MLVLIIVNQHTFNISLSDFFAENKPELEPDLRRLLDTTKKLTPQEREKLTSLLMVILETRTVHDESIILDEGKNKRAKS